YSSLLPFYFSSSSDLRDLPSFPTRRSSDLSPNGVLTALRMNIMASRFGTVVRASLLTAFSLLLATGTVSAQKVDPGAGRKQEARSEEHTSELQSRGHLVCRLLPEKKKKRSA